MKLSKPAFVGTTALLLSLSSQAALYTRDLDGNLGNGHEGVYDNVLDITWLADANLAATEYFGVSFDFPGSGSTNNARANNWIIGMNQHEGTGYLGYNGWRLPSTDPVNGTAYDVTSTNNGTTDQGYNITSTASELSYMYYVNLGNIGKCAENNLEPYGCEDQTGWEATNSGPFSNFQAHNGAQFYWSDDYNSCCNSFTLRPYFGDQIVTGHTVRGHMWAVHDGDIGTAASAVPIPAAAWLFLSALAGLSITRRLQS